MYAIFFGINVCVAKFIAKFIQKVADRVSHKATSATTPICADGFNMAIFGEVILLLEMAQLII
jgi:hypothetical protein